MKYTVIFARPAVWETDIGVVQTWHKQIGHAVSVGETLVTVTLPSGEGVIPVVSPAQGILSTKVILPGEVVEVGEPIAILAGVPRTLVTGAERLPVTPASTSPAMLPETVRVLSPRAAALSRALAQTSRDAAPQYTVAYADVTEALRLGAKLRLPLLPFVAHTVGVSLALFPDLNARWADEPDGGASIRQFTGVHLGLVRHDANGLQVAVVPDVPHKSLRALADELALLQTSLDAGGVPAAQSRGAMFLLSEAIPGVAFQTGLLQSPLAAHLCIGAVESPARLTLSLSTDARIVAPAVASAFLSEVCRGLAEARFLFAG